jgi:DNA repair exonuclease SbcCD ATPase subunit
MIIIIFESVQWRNFLSTGNTWTTVQLNKVESTLIVGHNGAGKSTMLDALSFALFGKAHRNINKPQLVNSINNKDCIVEVAFSVGPSKFRIVRGIKPAVFEIWKNGTLFNQSSTAREYQKILEQNILKLNHKSFHQIVVLGSSSFVPFMQLAANHRREVIEDLLDINVFSKMNILLKEKNSILKENIKDLMYNLDLKKNSIDLQKKYIRDITAMNKEEIESKHIQIKNAENEIVELQKSSLTSSEFIEQYSEKAQSGLNQASSKKQTLMTYRAQFNSKIKEVVSDAKFYEENDNCPTCTQSIEDQLRTSKLGSAKEKALELNGALTQLEEQARSIEGTIQEFSELSEQIRHHQSEINSNNQGINRIHSSITELNKDISRLDAREGDAGKANDELDIMKSDVDNLTETRLTFNEEMSYNSVMGEMLKDTGIKTKVIKQYLPVINQLVNQHLQVLDFFVHFSLDESFQEVIRSRHRDSFSYDSFSEGEKQRIDLALLFTWRMIAKMKNSVSTNLLVLDETFDSSLDHDGVDNLIKILYTLDEDTNVFIISHKGEILDGKFKEKIEFKNDKNFSYILA